MIKFRVIGLGIILLFGCKEKMNNFFFNASKLNHLSKYEYLYKNGRKELVSEKFYTLMFGNIVDSMITKTIYEYNKKGLLVKEITNFDYKKKPDLKLLSYDLKDSLISIVYIDSGGDTSFIEKYAYFPDGMRTVYHRHTTTRIDASKDLKSASRNRVYDTVLFTREYKYENRLCKLLKEYNKNKSLTNVVEFEYKGSNVFKEIHYSVFNDLKMYVKSKYFDYSKNILNPEYFSLDKDNDTIEYKKYEFEGNKLVSTTESYQNGNMKNKVYYKKGRKIGEVGINKEMNFKVSYLFSYYDNGDVMEEKSYDEKINAR